MITSVLAYPRQGMSYPEGVRVVAVEQSTGAFGVGICPGAAMRHLVGLPDRGAVRYFLSPSKCPLVEKYPGQGWRVVLGIEFERCGGINYQMTFEGVCE